MTVILIARYIWFWKLLLSVPKIICLPSDHADPCEDDPFLDGCPVVEPPVGPPVVTKDPQTKIVTTDPDPIVRGNLDQR